MYVRYSFGLCLRIFRSFRTVRPRQFGWHLQPERVHQSEMSWTRQHVLRPLRLSNRHPQMPLRLLERAAGLRKIASLRTKPKIQLLKKIQKWLKNTKMAEIVNVIKIK